MAVPLRPVPSPLRYLLPAESHSRGDDIEKQHACPPLLCFQERERRGGVPRGVAEKESMAVPLRPCAVPPLRYLLPTESHSRGDDIEKQHACPPLLCFQERERRGGVARSRRERINGCSSAPCAVAPLRYLLPTESHSRGDDIKKQHGCPTLSPIAPLLIDPAKGAAHYARRTVRSAARMCGFGIQDSAPPGANLLKAAFPHAGRPKRTRSVANACASTSALSLCCCDDDAPATPSFASLRRDVLQSGLSRPFIAAGTTVVTASLGSPASALKLHLRYSFCVMRDSICATRSIDQARIQEANSNALH